MKSKSKHMKCISIMMVLILGTSLGTSAQNWALTGNSITGTEQFGTTNNFDLNFITNNNLRMTLKSSGFLGLGTTSPNAWQEIQYCPPSTLNESGLIVTLNRCSGGLTALGEMNADVIGFGIDPVTPETEFTVPFSYFTGHITSIGTPLYTVEQPIFWVRQRIPPGFNPSTAATDQFETKFIVMPDGSCGINITKPRAALDVRGSQGINMPAALIGSRALGTGFVDPSTGLYQYFTQQVQFVPVLGENGYNQIVEANDQGMFFTDGKGADGSNLQSAFVIAPWAENRNPNIGGMRMDASGNTEFHGTLRATKIKVDIPWWSDFVFAEDYELMSIGELENYLLKYKHLPDMPSEEQVLSDGVDVAEIQAKQQQKIEELYLYIIQLQKQIEQLKTDLVPSTNTQQ